MYQQSPDFINKDHSSFDSNFLHKYLPIKEGSLGDSKAGQDVSLLCTPENYMLVLSYSNSLQKENQALRRELASTKKSLQQFHRKNRHLEENMKKIQPIFFSNLSLKSNRHSTQMSAKTLFKRKQSAPLTERSIDPHPTISAIDGTNSQNDYLDRQIIEELRKDNEFMAHKIQQLFREKENLINNHIQSKTSLKKLKKSGENYPFDNIKLNPQNQNKKIDNHFDTNTKNNKTTFFDRVHETIPANNYVSEPCSFQISFQVPPSFKSLRFLPQTNHKPLTNRH